MSRPSTSGRGIAGGCPAFSIVVPTWERPERLRRCLEALARLDEPAGGFEVVVVDDGGTRPLGALDTVPRERLDVHCLRVAHAGPGAARNAGAQVARGRWLAFTDDDCLPDPGWLRALERRAAARPDCMLGGRTLNGRPDNVYARADQVIAEAVHAHYNTGRSARFFASNNMAVPREAFLALGGFDPEFRPASEDRDLCDRWIASGRSLLYVDDALVRHGHRSTLGGFLRQHFGYGRGAARFRRVRAARGRGALAEVARFHGAFLAGVGPLLSREPGRRGRLLMLLASWQLANAAGFSWEEIRLGLRGEDPARAQRRDAV